MAATASQHFIPKQISPICGYLQQVLRRWWLLLLVVMFEAEERVCFCPEIETELGVEKQVGKVSVSGWGWTNGSGGKVYDSVGGTHYFK